ncbi:hypothetical protein [Streptomyces sp. NPDC058108]|uniref:hypothetical protein n=1 Tax=Streptomyces sp. NPDC058108 TaxID=3346344 RepID=UPI0036E29092
MSTRNAIEDLFRRRTRPAGDGHLNWTGYRNKKGTATLHWNGSNHSALRIAYRIRTGSDPIGYAHATCEHPGCVAPKHAADSAVTPRRGHHTGPINRQPNSSDDQVKALLREELSDRQIGKRLRTSPKRVAALRAELGIPSRPVTFEGRWDANTEPADGGHIRWTGRFRAGSNPAIAHEGRDTSPRRIAFERLHGRPAVGRVLPGCGYGPCVRPEHLEDQPMRDQLASQYAAIFGEVAA